MVKLCSFLMSVTFAAIFHVNAAAPNSDDITSNYNEKLTQGQAYWSQEQLDQLQKPLAQASALSGKEKPFSGKQTATNNDVLYKILITDAMGDTELRTLISSLSHRKDVSFVTKGFLPTDRTFGDISKRLFRLLKGLDEVPNISLDPRVFNELQATTAPVIAAYRGNELIAMASGIANPSWLADQIEAGETGNLGNFGNVVTITEIAPEVVAQERAKKLDWDKIKQQAQDNYWKNIAFYGLPNAPETITRRFQPVVTVNEPILDADGNEIISVGQSYNMLEQLPLSKRVVVFDATDPVQMSWVLNLPKGDRPTKFITTRFDNSKKANGIKEIEAALGASVYLVNQDVINTFDLRYSPTIAFADNQTKEFVIQEFRLDETDYEQ